METESSQSIPVPSSDKKITDKPVSQLTAEEKAAKRTQFIIIAVAVVFVALLVTAIVLMAKFPTATVVVRDIAIVFVAVTTFLMGLAMILLIFQLQVLIQVLRDEVQPLLRSVNDTASTVRGTTAFVSHNVVSPVIKLAGFSAGIRQVLSDTVSVIKAARPHQSKSSDTE
ncbi:MAG: hypothetical protein P1S60_07445 [Anaerolineae bacterium]|nr:hypothetical protein [Anaerolineae bacterium]